MDLNLLRASTRGEHEATEAAMPLLDSALDPEHYVVALAAMYRAVRTWDWWAERHAPADLGDMMAGRRRSELLAGDLRHFGEALPQLDQAGEAAELGAAYRSAGGEEDRRAAFLGMLYVVEGSTLGGQWIAQRVEAELGLHPGVGDAYFRGYGADTGRKWQEVRAVLAAVPEQHAGVVIEAARQMFAFFRVCLRGALPHTEDAHLAAGD